MSRIAEIEAAIEKLSAPQVDELAAWLEVWRAQRSQAVPVENWLARARGSALAGVTTADILALSRGE